MLNCYIHLKDKELSVDGEEELFWFFTKLNFSQLSCDWFEGLCFSIERGYYNRDWYYGILTDYAGKNCSLVNGQLWSDSTVRPATLIPPFTIGELRHNYRNTNPVFRHQSVKRRYIGVLTYILTRAKCAAGWPKGFFYSFTPIDLPPNNDQNTWFEKYGPETTFGQSRVTNNNQIWDPMFILS